MSGRPPDRSFLGTIDNRRSILSALEDGPRDKRDLVTDLACSRSTVDRAIRDLEALALVERVDGAYRLTIVGRLALAEYRRSRDRLETIAGMGEYLEGIPRTAPLSPSMLEGATVHEPEPHAPTEPLMQLADRIDDAEHVRGFTGTERSSRVRDRLNDRILGGSLAGEIVLTEELVTFLLEHQAERLQAVADSDFDLYVVESVPYELVRIDTPSRSETFLVIDHDVGNVVLRNDSTDACEWGDVVYRRYRAMAEKLEPPA